MDDNTVKASKVSSKKFPFLLFYVINTTTTTTQKPHFRIQKDSET